MLTHIHILDEGANDPPPPPPPDSSSSFSSFFFDVRTSCTVLRPRYGRVDLLSLDYLIFPHAGMDSVLPGRLDDAVEQGVILPVHAEVLPSMPSILSRHHGSRRTRGVCSWHACVSGGVLLSIHVARLSSNHNTHTLASVLKRLMIMLFIEDFVQLETEKVGWRGILLRYNSTRLLLFSVWYFLFSTIAKCC